MSLFAAPEVAGVVVSRPVVTTYAGTNADLVAEVVRLYPLDALTVADITYGQGGFWRKVDTSRFTLLGSDAFLDPALLVQLPLWAACAPVLYEDDFRALRYEAASIDVVVFDPPYLHNPGQGLEMNRLYRNHATTQGLYHADILRELYCRGLQEAWRVLRPGGLLWVKGKDEIESGRQCWSHAEVRTAAERVGFVAVDQFFLVTQGGLSRSSGQPQQHAQKNQSWLWVLRRPPTVTLGPRGRPKKGSASTTLKRQRGKSYLQARLLRDHPAIYARYMAGELPSVHAAAKVAGLVTTKSGH